VTCRSWTTTWGNNFYFSFQVLQYQLEVAIYTAKTSVNGHELTTISLEWSYLGWNSVGYIQLVLKLVCCVKAKLRMWIRQPYCMKNVWNIWICALWHTMCGLIMCSLDNQITCNAHVYAHHCYIVHVKCNTGVVRVSDVSKATDHHWKAVLLFCC